MKFGMTYEERKRKAEAGLTKFALFPTKLSDGRTVWFERYTHRLKTVEEYTRKHGALSRAPWWAKEARA